jgi:predicted metal-dependent hydrolase
MRHEDIHKLLEWHKSEVKHCRVAHGRASTSRTRARWEQRRRAHARTVTLIEEYLRGKELLNHYLWYGPNKDVNDNTWALLGYTPDPRI